MKFQPTKLKCKRRHEAKKALEKEKEKNRSEQKKKNNQNSFGRNKTAFRWLSFRINF